MKFKQKERIIFQLFLMYKISYPITPVVALFLKYIPWREMLYSLNMLLGIWPRHNGIGVTYREGDYCFLYFLWCFLYLFLLFGMFILKYKITFWNVFFYYQNNHSQNFKNIPEKVQKESNMELQEVIALQELDTHVLKEREEKFHSFFVWLNYI